MYAADEYAGQQPEYPATELSKSEETSALALRNRLGHEVGPGYTGNTLREPECRVHENECSQHQHLVIPTDGKQHQCEYGDRGARHGGVLHQEALVMFSTAEIMRGPKLRQVDTRRPDGDDGAYGERIVRQRGKKRWHDGGSVHKGQPKEIEDDVQRQQPECAAGLDRVV
jgi:hypothetical protein